MRAFAFLLIWLLWACVPFVTHWLDGNDFHRGEELSKTFSQSVGFTVVYIVVWFFIFKVNLFDTEENSKK